MQIGITTFNLEDFDFQVQLNSMLKNKVEPNFVILHYAGWNNVFIKYYRFLIKTIKHYRFKSLSFILNKNKMIKHPTTIDLAFSQNEKNNINAFLKNVLIIKAQGINDKSTIKKIKSLQRAIIVCNSDILKARVLGLPNFIFLNIHTSLLPYYRGMNSVEWALYENQDIYVTVHRIARGIDEGAILYQEKIDIENKNLASIAGYRKYCFFKSNEIIGKAIYKLLNHEIKFIEQKKKYHPLLQYYVMHPILKKRLENKLSRH